MSWDFNHAWSTFYASGPEILRYWQRVAAKYDVIKYIRFSHNVVRANWNETIAQWEVTVVDSVHGEQKVDQADVLVTAVGILNQWTWPSIPGLKSFRGKLMHSAAWDEDFQVEVGLSLVSPSISMTCPNLSLTGQNSRRDWRWFQWHPNRSSYSAEGAQIASLCSRTHLDCDPHGHGPYNQEEFRRRKLHVPA